MLQSKIKILNLIFIEVKYFNYNRNETVFVQQYYFESDEIQNVRISCDCSINNEENWQNC